ncbi:MAG: GNAT family N-acetyltransferase [Gemmatimonadota bacterium]|jgi:phosphinothricin acetyltransferase
MAPHPPIALRLATAADAPAVRDIYAPSVRDTAISFEYDVPTVEEMGRRMEAVRSAGYPWLVAKTAGQVSGYAYASAFRDRKAYDWTTEVSVYVHADHARRGIGRTIYGTLLRVLELQGFRSAYGVATAPNPASEALHGALGFERVGYFPRVGFKFDVWHDVICWHIGLGSEGGSPGEIRPVAEVLEAAGVAPS